MCCPTSCVEQEAVRKGEGPVVRAVSGEKTFHLSHQDGATRATGIGPEA